MYKAYLNSQGHILVVDEAEGTLLGLLALVLTVCIFNVCPFSFAAETPVSSPSHGEPATPSRDVVSSRDAPCPCIWKPCTKPCGGDLGREQDSRRKGKLGLTYKQITGHAGKVGRINNLTRLEWHLKKITHSNVSLICL